MTARELCAMDPVAAREVWDDGYLAGQLRTREIEHPRAWNRGYLMGILTAALALGLLAVL